MKNKKRFLLFGFLSLLALFVSSCSISFSSDDGLGFDSSSDGGVFVSTNKGEEWKQVVSIPTIKGSPESIKRINVSDLVMDPSDYSAVYLGSVSNGLFYTFNIVKGWQKANTLPLSRVRSVAVDPKDKCTIYATGENKVFKSNDCSRTWEQVYYDNDLQISVNTVAVDHHNNDNIYIGTERGDVLKSNDKGKSWEPIFRGDDDIDSIKLSPFDSRIIFVSTDSDGTARSMDGGMTWKNLEKNLKDFKNSKNFRDLEFALDEKGKVFLATTYGLLRSLDYGDSWTRIELLTPEKESTINSLALGENSQIIYYVTDTTFYRSQDGGKSWTTKSLPTSRFGSDLLVSPDNSDIVYLGVKKEK